MPTTSGTGNGTITATYQQNLTPVIRTANLLVNGTGTIPATVKVIQLPSFVSLDENPETTLQVYPNPTTGLFVINNPTSELQNMKVTILDVHGQIVLSKFCANSNSYSFDLSNEAKGNYFMKIETGKKIHVIKIVVQ
jgi:hypothetical protein